MKKRWKPILALLVLSPLLTELLTGSAPASAFFQPWLFLLLATVGYGFPVLVIREIAIRKNFGLLGLFFLGVAYGLYNEALVARTIFNPFHSPVDTFAIYGLIGNIRIPWALTISFWHALHAVIYPIAFVSYLWPDHAREPWINKKAAWFLGLGSVIFGILTFFSGPPANPRGEVGDFIFIILSWALLWWLSNRFSGTPKIALPDKTSFNWKIPSFGIGLYVVLFFLPLIFSKLNLGLILFVTYFLLITIFFIRKFSMIQEVPVEKLVLIGLGGEIPVALFAILISLPFGRMDQVLVDLVFLAAFIFFIVKLKSKLRLAAL